MKLTSKNISASVDAYAYSITVRRVKIGEDLLFKGTVAELPHVATFEKTFEEAYALAVDAIESLIESAVEDSRPFPAPLSKSDSSEYSGRITLRMPRWLHAQLGAQSNSEGISLNQYLISILSSAGSINALVDVASEKICRNIPTYRTTISDGFFADKLAGAVVRPLVKIVVADQLGGGGGGGGVGALFRRAEGMPQMTEPTSFDFGTTKYHLSGNC